MAYYISFLKTLSLKLNNHTVHFFYNEVRPRGGGGGRDDVREEKDNKTWRTYCSVSGYLYERYERGKEVVKHKTVRMEAVCNEANS